MWSVSCPPLYPPDTFFSAASRQCWPWQFSCGKSLHHNGISNGSHGGKPFSLTLTDGTRVGGLLFLLPAAGDEPKPLLMASFGFLQDSWGTRAAKFYELYLKESSHRLPAHVLILDHPWPVRFWPKTAAFQWGLIRRPDVDRSRPIPRRADAIERYPSFRCQHERPVE